LQYPNGLGQILSPISNALPSEAQVIEKTKFSCCGVAEFDKFLKDSNRSQIIMVGMEMHICVMQTALELDAGSDYQPWVVLDATGSRHRDSYDYSMARLSSNGIALTETEAVLFEWLRDAGNPKFKEISALLH
ncbi:MAG: isochorismatase family protein, partial [Candidatus Porifericomitaceae bacterium WSBS_2022_MAG_OTU9]